MNIEELELSLRSEFESQIKSVLAGIKRDVADFHKNFEAEFEKHRAELDRSIADLSSRLPETAGFDPAFSESVVEHLRLARDDGAQVAATAFGEAEKLKEATTAAAPSYDQIKAAVKDISSKNSQASILKALVDHAGKFAARGAFFIARNDQLIGWNVFGAHGSATEEMVRQIILPAESNTSLSSAVRSMSAGSSSGDEFSGDSQFLSPLGFAAPAQKIAVPLTARGRGVAVLYADSGENGEVNADALETLVQVASLTVELLAAAQLPKPTTEVQQPEPEVTRSAEPIAEHAAENELPSDTFEPQHDEPASAEPAEFSHAYEAPPVSFSETAEFAETAEAPAPAEIEEPYSYSPSEEGSPAVFENQTEAAFETVEEYTGVVSFEDYTAEETQAEEVTAAEPETAAAAREPETPLDAAEYALETNDQAVSEGVTDFAFGEEKAAAADEVSTPDSEPEPEPVERFAPAPAEEPAVISNGHAVNHAAEPVVEVVTADVGRTRLSDRNVDLPIEVADDERRLHNDARRFARLLVSEIKLYNEQKVVEGRESGDLYDRLREAIDRSREMYDKRVQPAVASKFDYFHYELVNSLAEGDVVKLGGSYPGAAV